MHFMLQIQGQDFYAFKGWGLFLFFYFLRYGSVMSSWGVVNML